MERRHDREEMLRTRLRLTPARRGELVAGRKRPRPEPVNTACKLARCEIGDSGRRRTPWRYAPPSVVFPSNCHEMFRHMKLQEEVDIYNAEFPSHIPPQLWRRSNIVEIIGAKELILACTKSGLCVALNRSTNNFICHLNQPDELISSIFYNKINESILVLSGCTSDNSESVRCKAIPIEYIGRGHHGHRFPFLFGSESFDQPHVDFLFYECDCKVLVHRKLDGILSVFDMKSYKFLYSIDDQNIEHISTSPGILLLFYKTASTYVPMTLVSIEDGKKLKTISYPMDHNRLIDFGAIFNEKLLIKLRNENLHITDLRNHNVTNVENSQSMIPLSFIYHIRNNLCFTMQNRIETWNVHGEVVTSFEDLYLVDVEKYDITVHNRNETMIISYCPVTRGVNDEGDAVRKEDSPTGSININNTFSGKCIFKISPNGPILVSKTGDGCQKISHSTVREALRGVRSLFYDDERNVIYTSNEQGMLHRWSN